MSHETWQVVNSFECRFPYTVLDIKGCLQFILFKKSFVQIYILLTYDSYIIFLLLSLVLKNLTNYGRRHSKLFTNCHVSWETLYFKKLNFNIRKYARSLKKCKNIILFPSLYISTVLLLAVISIQCNHESLKNPWKSNSRPSTFPNTRPTFEVLKRHFI